MNSNNKEYKIGTYVNKKVRQKRLEKMCPVCKKCPNKSFCKHRKNVKLMRKCENCKECNDKEHCYVFYIIIQHKITIPVAFDDENGKIIRKSFSGKSSNEAIYNSEKYKKDIESGIIKPKLKKTINSIVTIIEKFEEYKNRGRRYK